MRSRLGRNALVAASVAVVCAAFFASLPALLDGSDPLPDRADAIFVFPGEAPERQRCAAELYRRGIAPRLMLSGGVVRAELAALGQPLTEGEIGARLLELAGVPRDAIILVPEGTSTWEDAWVLRRWAQESGARRIVAVTSPLHARRARRSLEIALAPLGIDVRLVACGQRLSTTRAWWLEERPLIAVVNEAAKTLLYAVRYFAPAAFGRAVGPQNPAAMP
jgi:hypothetical protein